MTDQMACPSEGVLCGYCDQLADERAAFLTDSERAEIREHLEICDLCAVKVTSIRTTMQLADADVEPPAFVVSEVLAERLAKAAVADAGDETDTGFEQDTRGVVVQLHTNGRAAHAAPSLDARAAGERRSRWPRRGLVAAAGVATLGVAAAAAIAFFALPSQRGDHKAAGRLDAGTDRKVGAGPGDVRAPGPRPTRSDAGPTHTVGTATPDAGVPSPAELDAGPPSPTESVDSDELYSPAWDVTELTDRCRRTVRALATDTDEPADSSEAAKKMCLDGFDPAKADGFNAEASWVVSQGGRSYECVCTALETEGDAGE